jgi:hypothetical protein
MIVTVVYVLAVVLALALAGILLEGAIHRHAGLRLERDLREAEEPTRPPLSVIETAPRRASHRHAA